MTQSKTAKPAEPVRALHSNNRVSSVSSVNKSQPVPAKPSYSAEAEEEIQEILPIKSEPSCGGAEQQQCTEYAEEDYADADYAYEEAVEAYGAAEASAVTADGNKGTSNILCKCLFPAFKTDCLQVTNGVLPYSLFDRLYKR